MRPDHERHLADVLREQREQLERVRDEVDTHFDELLAVAVRMLDIEKFLVADAERQERRERRKLHIMLGHWSAPRIGILRQHLPAPLLVPKRYLRTTPPRNPPTISIVVPSFQQGRYIERTLASVVNQRYPGLELIVQDGGSSDGTVDVLRRCESRLTHWVSEPDGGQADAINRGFQRTSGEIMAYLNSDDLLLPGSLAYVGRYFAEHADVDVIYGNRVIIDEDDHKIGSWVLPRHDDETLTLVDYVPQETLFWRRSAWEAAGGALDVSLDFAVDWDLLLRLREAGARIVRVPRFLGAFRAHDEQKTHRQLELCDRECDQLRERVHGRGMSIDEAVARVQPYLRRHIVHHTWHRLGQRLPLPRHEFRVGPIEPQRRPAEPRVVLRSGGDG